ncbi:hypothetical protein N8I74_04055 [Chitiniphilus purpureus]|uniref:Uncharacterized protein n=1 Tax=Chitiniphilus purpureus TaxID=2981137 RepID=A0ABY6DPP8_9NEIS|nr:hypothetical protein [Chitiniphilus sp. CD1]UXY16203.1 hypothetical protein N8I74_04055 [Chitiniphilus sp. CD1]
MSDQTCNHCGARMRAMDTQQAGHNENEAYYCPACNKRFKVYAAFTPTVTLLSPRTDGKTDQYQNSEAD